MVKNQDKEKSVRLPTHIKPEHYWLSLVPDFKNFTFKGQESITIEISKPDLEIRLHSKDLNIDSAFVSNGKTEWDCQISFDEKLEQLILKTEEILPVGVYNLHIVFNGILNDKMRGFYRSEFKLKGKTEHIAVTQFEPTDARKAFPCFDEPAQKASFSLELLVPQGLEAISNTVVTSKTRQKNGLVRVKFTPTPIMSTYLLAIVIGKFEFIEDLTEDGVTVRVFVTPGKKEQAEFSLETAKGVLTFFNKYFKIKYPLPILNMVAIPDFAAGAMENWGCVTYRETAILVDPKNTSTLAKQWVGLVIAHELAHQWFGNLVTMKWWTHLWLNEGFASFISYYAVDHLYPEWNMWSQFINSDLSPALELDSLKNTHPIQVEVNNPDEINEIFDEVSYAKGASVLRMLANYLGETKFRDGLRHYLKKHSYSNASTEDLWKSLEIVSRKPVRKIMSTWTEEEGYPLVTVTEKKNKLVLTQKRFFLDPKQKAGAKPIWSVPINIGNYKKKTQVLFNKKSLSIPKPKGPYAKLNIGETGLFRVKYQPSLMKQFLPAIESSRMQTADRLGLLRDSIALARAGALQTDKVLELLATYKNEQKYTAWVQIGVAVGQINHVFKNEKFAPELERFSQKVFDPIVEAVGWEPLDKEDTSKSLLRTFVLYRAGHYGNKAVISQAQKLFSELHSKKTVIPADLRGVVYNLVAENGSAKQYDILLKQYRAETLQEEKNRIARAMALFPNEVLLKKYLKFVLSSEVRPQDAPLLLGVAWNNKVAKEVVWDFIVQNWPFLLKNYGDGGHLLVRLIEPMGNFTTEKQAKMVQKFFKQNSAPGGERTVQQAIEDIRIQALWQNRDKIAVYKFLNKQK